MDKYEANFDLIKTGKKNIIFHRYVALPNYNGNFEVRFFKEIQALIFDDIIESISDYLLDLTIEHLYLLLDFIYKITTQNNDKELTADKMFKKLGYKKRSSEEYEKTVSNGIVIQIIVYESGEYMKLSYQSCMDWTGQPEIITVDEDKAIHKKIEELKGEKNDK